MTGLIDVRLDAESLEGTQSVLSRWLKQAGDPVRAHEPIAELETDKVVVELAAPADGVLVGTGVAGLLKLAKGDTLDGQKQPTSASQPARMMP